MSFRLKKIAKQIGLTALSMLILTSCGDEKIKVLILSGSNNHNWKETTPIIKSTLEENNRFSAQVTDEPAEIIPEDLEHYDVILSNWNTWPEVTGKRWNPELEKAFVNFISGGKGFVAVHAASATLHDWQEFQQIVGGTCEPGVTGHGSLHIFKVEFEENDHPINKGLQDFYIRDELWHKVKLHKETKNLAYAFSDVDNGGSGENEPVFLTTSFGKGRGFYSILGHDKIAMRNNGWKTLLLRGTEWAATGNVTINPLAPWPSNEAASPEHGEE